MRLSLCSSHLAYGIRTLLLQTEFSVSSLVILCSSHLAYGIQLGRPSLRGQYTQRRAVGEHREVAFVAQRLEQRGVVVAEGQRRNLGIPGCSSVCECVGVAA